MIEFRWIIMSSFLMLLFNFTATEEHPLSFTVGAEDKVTLPCENVIDDQDKCNSTPWLFSYSGNATALFELGQIHEEAKSKSDRLSVTANCSLVIKTITVEDFGQYSYRQFNKTGKHQDVVDATTTTTTSVNMNTSEGWRFIMVSVGLSGLLISVVTVNIWTRTKGNKTQIDENMEHNDEDEDDGTVNYENIGEPSASVRLH